MDWQKDIYFEEDNFGSLNALSVIVMGLGIISQSILFATLGSIFFLFIFLNNYYLKKIGDKLFIKNIKHIVKLFPGEQNNITLQFSQLSLLPIFNGKLVFTLGDIVKIEDGISKLKESFQVVTVPFSILGKQTIDITIPFEANRRGATRIKSLEIIIPHLFGFGEVRLFYKKLSLQEILIYPIPKVVIDAEKIIPRIQGDYPFQNSYFEDVATITGTRQYNGADPFNKIHWKATARSNTIQTKVFNKTTQYSWTILLDINHPYFEDIVSGITYFFEYLTRNDVPYELYVNVGSFYKKPYIYLSKGSGREHLQKALEVLARLSQYSFMAIPFVRMVANLNRDEPLSPFVMICSEIVIPSVSRLKHANYYFIHKTETGMKLKKYRSTEEIKGGGLNAK